MSRVLVVDDDYVIQNLNQLQLRARGHRVVGVESPTEALEVVRGRGAPDVAVLDVMMPEMDGFELLGALRSLDGLAELPVIFLSARVQPHDIAAGRALGAAYLTKPYVAFALLDAIDRSVADDRW